VNDISSSNGDELLDLSAAAKYLKISNRVLRDLCKRRLVSYARINYRNWRFRKSDLDAYLAKRRVMAR
jgi:excisionase family DNA binding protein